MKHRIQKITSLVLALMMLVTMIPMGMITAIAEGADYSIASVEEWNALAEQKLDFDGKTVSLGADIDAKSAALKPLSADFKGVFEGNGKKISNATVAGGGLIATSITGTATIQNLLLENIDVTSAGIAGILIGSIDSTGDITVTKVSIDKSSSVTGAGHTGGLIGSSVIKEAGASINISYVSVEATVSTTAGGAGGFVGYDKSTDGAINIENSAALASVTNSGTGDYIFANGLFGYYYGMSTKGSMPLNLTNVVVGGSQEDFTVLDMYNGNVNYTSLYIVAGTKEKLFGATAYNSWINTVRTKGIAPEGKDRRTITRASIILRKQVEADDPVGFVPEAPKEIVSAADVVTMENGFISKVGRDIGNPTLDLSDYETTEQFLIKCIADWELIAASDLDFAGKKILLDTDIDGMDERLSPLSMNFAGSFDGQGHTVKNVTVSGGGLIATKLNATSDVTIEHLKIENVKVNYQASHGGVLIGLLEGSDANVTVQKITVESSSVVSGGYTGGLIGHMNLKAANKATTVNIRQVSVKASVEATADAMQAGGLIGHDKSNGSSETNTLTMNISDSVFLGSVKSRSYANGLIGHYQGGNNLNGGGVLADADNWAYLNLKNLVIGGGVHHKVLALGGGVINYSNIYLTDCSGTLFGATSYGSWLNGHVTKTIGATADELAANPALDMNRGSITAEEMTKSKLETPIDTSKDEAKLFVLLDANGFVKTVPDGLQVTAVQRSVEVKDGTYALRFIAPMYLGAGAATNVNMQVVATYQDENGVLQTLIFDTTNPDCHDNQNQSTSGCSFYHLLTVYDAYGVGEGNLTAKSLGAKVLAGFTIYDIPVDAEKLPEGICFAATMRYTNAFGKEVFSRTVTVTVDQTGTILP